MTARPLNDNQRAVLSTRMSDATAGQVLGWAVARVRREREPLKAEATAPAAAEAAPPPHSGGAHSAARGARASASSPGARAHA